MEDNHQNNNNRNREIKGVISLALALFLLLCFFSYSPHDPSFTRFVADGTATHNLTGKFGSYSADSIFRLLGIAAFFIPAALLAGAFHLFLRPAFFVTGARAGGLVFLTLAFSGLLQAAIKGGVIVYGETMRAGGLIGELIVYLGFSIRQAPILFLLLFLSFLPFLL